MAEALGRFLEVELLPEEEPADLVGARDAAESAFLLRLRRRGRLGQ